jgi:hypothetical protein
MTGFFFNGINFPKKDAARDLPCQGGARITITDQGIGRGLSPNVWQIWIHASNSSDPAEPKLPKSKFTVRNIFKESHPKGLGSQSQADAFLAFLRTRTEQGA